MSNSNWLLAERNKAELRLWNAQGPELLASKTQLGIVKNIAQIEEELRSLAPDAKSVLLCGDAVAGLAVSSAFTQTPCKAPDLNTATLLKTQAPELTIHLISGISQKSPLDVLTSASLAVRGFLQDEPKFDGILCIPGENTAWVHISAEEVVSFRSFATPLMHRDLVRHLDDNTQAGTFTDQSGFEQAVSDAMSRPAGFTAELSSLLAAPLLGQPIPTDRLIGLLIGLELAAARPYWLGQEVAIASGHELSESYQTALTAQAAWCRSISGKDLVAKGLQAAVSVQNDANHEV